MTAEPWPPEGANLRTFDVRPAAVPDRPGLSPGRVTELVEEYRRHRTSPANAARCTCGERRQCVQKRLAWGELYAAGQGAEIWLRGVR